MNRPHRCDERCICSIDGKPLYYGGGQHACSDPDCENAHGIWIDFRGLRVAI